MSGATAEERQARRAQPCGGCAKPEAAGWCEACVNRSAAEDLIAEATLTVAAAWADVADRADVAAVLAHVEAAIRTELDQALSAAARRARWKRRWRCWRNAAARSALSVLGRSEPPDTEAWLAYEARMRSWHRYATRAAAKETSRGRGDDGCGRRQRAGPIRPGCRQGARRDAQPDAETGRLHRAPTDVVR
ncbi:hypothetical protein ABT187_49250 [Streptomyces sp. NPDC001817]|uniref:hypothetical protein n=1 Tax=Streptomyces sp. NPDC001817 TaxID=3154398 RepID=UPI003324B883